jgi:hypothetical protein
VAGLGLGGPPPRRRSRLPGGSSGTRQRFRYGWNHRWPRGWRRVRKICRPFVAAAGILLRSMRLCGGEMASPFRIPPDRRDFVRGRDHVRPTLRTREVRREYRERGEGRGRAGPYAGDGAGGLLGACPPDDGCRPSQQRVADSYLVSQTDLVSGGMVRYAV